MFAILDFVFMQLYQLRHRELKRRRPLKEHLAEQKKGLLPLFLSYGALDPIWQLLGPAV